MNTQTHISFKYKSREEILLRECIVLSGLVTQKQLDEIKVLYNKNVPYHNFLHALTVAQNVLQLSTKTYSIIEVQSLFFAALFHDAGHTGIAETLDEFRSLDMAFQGILDFEKKYNIQDIDYSIVRKAIMGTVFKNRSKNTNKYALLLADFDIATIGMEFPKFLYYCDFPISLEFGKTIDEWLLDINYFKFLMSVDKYIFRTDEGRKLFPEALRNIKKYTTLSQQDIKKAFIYWQENNITYKEFENYFYTLFPKEK